MTKIPENKTRKRLRIALCTLYLFEIFMCSMPYYQYISDNKLFSYSVFEMLAALGTGNTIGLPDSEFAAASTILPLNIIFVIIPIVGFFFCALDKQSNMKNIVSIFCCLFAVLAIMTIVTVNFLSLGSLLSLLLYLLISFLSALSIFARMVKPAEEENKGGKKA